MTILEDFKTGRLVVVPREATAETSRDWMEDANRENGQYLNLCSRCGWEFVGHKRRVVCNSCASPDHTSGLIALVEGMERERDEAKAQLRTGDTQYGVLDQQNKHLLARALAAEAERDALREALREIVKADTHLVWSGGSVPEPSHDELGACAQIAARALKEQNNE